MEYSKFYHRNGIDLSGTSIISYSAENQAKNGSREIPWESVMRNLSLSQAKADALIMRFVVNDETTFLAKFNEAIGGDGSELKRITTLHSSALLALICFWRVDPKHPITIKDVKYTKVFFECPNQVIDGRKPSNIDVVLVSEDGKTILLLESKFTEFYNVGQVSIADAYRRFYKELIKLWNNTITMDNSAEEDFILKLKNAKRGESEYLGGIKQMVSHLIGAVRGPKISSKHEEYQDAYKYASKIILGTILYRPNATKDLNKYDRYATLYHDKFGAIGSDALSVIRKVLDKKQNEIKQIEVLPTILSYQDVFMRDNSNLLLDNVVKTYFSTLTNR